MGNNKNLRVKPSVTDENEITHLHNEPTVDHTHLLKDITLIEKSIKFFVGALCVAAPGHMSCFVNPEGLPHVWVYCKFNQVRF